MNNFRKTIIANSIRKIISKWIFSRFKESNCIISINKVYVNKKINLAKIYYSLYGNIQKKNEVNFFLKKNFFLLKKEVNLKTNLRHGIDLKFFYDNALDFINKLDKLLKDI
jgi:ribosome-binding factor A